MPQTAYMGMEKNSSPETRKRAADLAEVIGANHLDLSAFAISKPRCRQLSLLKGDPASHYWITYANLNSTALTPYMTHKLSSSPRPLVLSQNSRCMAALKCRILRCSMSSTLLSHPSQSKIRSLSLLHVSNLFPRNMQARLRMVRECPFR